MSVAAGGVPKLSWVSIPIMQSCKASVGIALSINFDGNVGGTQLSDHRVQIAHAKVNHPGLLWVPKIVTVMRKGCECSGTCSLLPYLWVNAQMTLVPIC